MCLLCVCVLCCRRGIEQYLAKYPQHVDTRKVDDGHTALMIAAVCNYQDIVYLLASMVISVCVFVVCCFLPVTDTGIM